LNQGRDWPKFDFVVTDSSPVPSPQPPRKNVKVNHQQPFNPMGSPSLFTKLKSESSTDIIGDNNNNNSSPSLSASGNIILPSPTTSRPKKDAETIRRQRDMFIQQHQKAKALRETRSTKRQDKEESKPEPPPEPSYVSIPKMESFPEEKVSDFKHVIYNLLVAYFNDPSNSQNHFVLPIQFKENGQIRTGFKFNEGMEPEKKLPELYAQHIRKAFLEKEDQASIFIQDLYKFYLRASVELLSKYFEKRDKYTYLYEDIPLFTPGNSLEEAEERIRNMKTRARKMKKRKSNAL